ncbi:MAG: hypothetical protein GY853_16560 [PVC group bacterium]|nr:hypothetical protein [PVC group bacterium]
MTYYIKQKCGATYKFEEYKDLLIKDGIVYFHAQFTPNGKYKIIVIRTRTIEETNLTELKTEVIK